MKKHGIAFLLVLLLFAGCSKNENKAINPDLSKKKDNSEGRIQFIEEPKLEPVLAFEAILKFNYSGNSWAVENHYMGYVDQQGLVRRIVSQSKGGDGAATNEETSVIRKTANGFYCEERSDYSPGFLLVTVNDRGFVFERYENEAGESSQQAGSKLVRQEKYTVADNDNGEVWRSEYQTASVSENRYFEKEYAMAEFRQPNYVFQNSCVHVYQDLNPAGQPAFYSDEYQFSYTKAPDTGNVEARLVQWRHNLEADFDTSEKWESRSAEIEICIYRNMHSDDPKINVLN